MSPNIPHLQCQTRSRHCHQNQVPVNHIAEIEMYVILFVNKHTRIALNIAATNVQLSINDSAPHKPTYAMQVVTLSVK